MLAISHTIGLVLITVGAIVTADEFLLGDLAWGALAGIAGFIGLALLYRGLARGPMGVVAPLTAITSAAVPAGWGLLVDDESLAGTAWVGVVVALLAIGLAAPRRSSSRRSASPPSWRPCLPALVRPDVRRAGSDHRGLCALADRGWSPDDRERDGRLLLYLEARVTASARTGRYPASCHCRTRGHVLGALFLYATLEGDLAIVAVLSSLYPIATVILARLVLGERLTRPQQSGFVAAMVATTLIAI